MSGGLSWPPTSQRRYPSRRRNFTGRVEEGGMRNWRAWSSDSGPWIGRHRSGPAGCGRRHRYREVSHPVAQPLRDVHPTGFAVEQSHGASAEEAVRAEPALLRSGEGERAAASAHEPGPLHRRGQARRGVEMCVQPLAADGQAAQRQPPRAQRGGQSEAVVGPLCELVRAPPDRGAISPADHRIARRGSDLPPAAGYPAGGRTTAATPRNWGNPTGAMPRGCPAGGSTTQTPRLGVACL